MFAYFGVRIPWSEVVKRTVQEIGDDNCLGLAAQNVALMPVASTSPMRTGLFAHIPPSTSGIPAEERCVGKYVGAAAVESATSTTLAV